MPRQAVLQFLLPPHSNGVAWEAVEDAWRDARADADWALANWRLHGGGETYAAYRAAQDREDAAQDALSEIYRQRGVAELR
jgi:hypothetical protein